jgi:hypothetical protein
MMRRKQNGDLHDVRKEPIHDNSLNELGNLWKIRDIGDRNLKKLDYDKVSGYFRRV